METNIRILVRSVAILSVCLAGSLATGCLSTYDGPIVRREPQPELLQYRHVVEFPAERFSFEGDQGQLFEAFLTRVGVGYGDRVFLKTARPEDLDEGAASRLAERRTEAVSGFLRLHNIDVAALLGDDGEGAASGDTVTVLVHRYVAGLPACPDWTQQLSENQKNRPTSNWSCATATNFGMMVADPGDLVRGSDPGPGDGQLLARSVNRYRKGETTPLKDDVGTQDVFGASSQSATSSSSGSEN